MTELEKKAKLNELASRVATDKPSIPDAPSVTDQFCPTCGCPVEGVQADEGTAHYRSRSIDPYKETLAYMKAAQKVRNGRWVGGAPSHVLADFAKQLHEDGFQLVKRARAEQGEDR